MSFVWDGPLLAIDLGVAQARFSGRAAGDLARYGGDPEVATNMDAVAARIGFPLARWAQSRQVHGAEVHVTRDAAGLRDPAREGDGQVVAGPGLAGVVLTADCLPVVVAGEGAVAVLHAGWRGLAAGILEEGVARLRAAGAGGPLTAAIGPAAGGCCYEVGPDVREAFAADGVLQRDGAHTIDLPAIAARRLHAAGVTTIHDAGLCTMCHVDDATGVRRFFSHRADGGATGRQAAVAWLS